MNFNEFLNQAWSDHAQDAEGVAARIRTAYPLLDNPEKQVIPLANLITHVFGEHLGRWSEGIELLRPLEEKVASFEPVAAVTRSIAALLVASGDRSALQQLTPSDQSRVLAVAASALAGQNQTSRAARLFQDALEIADKQLSTDDPAMRALAVASNNLAIAFEEKAFRTEDENELMLLAARSARRFWEIAGGWLEVERAEYRLAVSCMSANQLDQAQSHALKCLEICRENTAPTFELFWAFEVNARVEAARGDEAARQRALDQAASNLAELSPDDRAFCSTAFEKIRY